MTAGVLCYLSNSLSITIHCIVSLVTRCLDLLHSLWLISFTKCANYVRDAEQYLTEIIRNNLTHRNNVQFIIITSFCGTI